MKLEVGAPRADESPRVEIKILLRQLSDPRARRNALGMLAYEAQRGNNEALLAMLCARDEPDVAAFLARIPGGTFATAWYEARDPRMATGGVAESPPQALVVTSLKAGHFEPRPEFAHELLRACKDIDLEVRERAAAVLLSDLSGSMRDALFLASLRDGEVWLGAPADPILQVLSLFLTGREEEAEACDPQGELLAGGIDYLDDASRLRLATSLLKRGRGHLSTVTLGLNWRSPERVDQGFQRLFPALLSQNRYDDLWRLAFQLSVHNARSIVLALAERGYAGGELLERALPLARAPIPPARPECCLPGRFVAWAGGQVYRFHDGLLFRQEHVVSTECKGATLAQRLAHTRISPDGHWRASGHVAIDLFDSEGARVHRFESQAPTATLDFSPCSRYARLVSCLNDRPGADSLSLFRLQPFGPVFEGRSVPLAWHWHGDYARIWRRDAPIEIELATGLARPLELPFPSRGHVWQCSPSGRRWVCSAPCQVHLWEEGAERRFPPGAPSFLSDDRLIIAHESGWSVWDGRRLLSVPRNTWETLDPWGARVLGGDHVQTEVLRFSEPRLVRVLQGRLQAFEGDRIVTQLCNGLALWRVPQDLLLGRARVEDANLLEPHDRELARLFLTERLRHEVELEPSFQVPDGRSIELG